MRDESDRLLNDVLSQWWAWRPTAFADNGYYTVNTTCRLYRPSRQRDDENGALDSDQHNGRMTTVDEAIDKMEQPWRTAVEFNARNLSTGQAVWRSPRLPTDDLERAHLVLHARAKLLLLLELAGIE